MPRKRREQVHGEAKKPTYYDDKTPNWMRALIEEDDDELAEVVPRRREWKTPKRVYLQFSEKDPEKEAYRNEIIQRKRKRRDSGRFDK